MKNKICVLDHGFVKLLNVSGPVRRTHDKKDVFIDVDLGEKVRTDSLYEFDADTVDVAKTARISFDNFEENRNRGSDLKLCEYLMKNKHNSPWEMIEVWLEMKLPIFVARQFVRHRTCSINEMSARYSILPNEWYIPKVVGGKAHISKQGQEDNVDSYTQEEFKSDLNRMCDESYCLYKSYLDDGVAPEHARMFLHVNHYTHWVWKQDLSNMMHFLSLRVHEHSQIEARIYAEAIYNLLVSALPEAMSLFDQYKRIQ